MKVNMLFGTLIGFTFVFLIMGVWRNEWDWSLWISMLIGGIIGHLLIAYLVKKNSQKDHN